MNMVVMFLVLYTLEALRDTWLPMPRFIRYVKLTKTGKNPRGACPFHSEQSPSFTVFPDTRRYKCFGCGASGDLFNFVMQREGWDMDTALRELAAQARVELPPQSVEEISFTFIIPTTFVEG